MYQGKVYFENGYMVDYVDHALQRALTANEWGRMLTSYQADRVKRIQSRDNYVFRDRLVVTGTRRNRLVVQSLKNKQQYTVFHRDIPKVITRSTLGIIEGLFTFRRNGRAFGLIPFPYEFEDHYEDVIDTKGKL